MSDEKNAYTLRWSRDNTHIFDDSLSGYTSGSYALHLLNAINHDDDAVIDDVLSLIHGIKTDLLSDESIPENTYRDVFKYLVFFARKNSRELDQYVKRYRDTQEKLKTAEEYSNKFRYGQRATANAQMKKMFIEYVRKHNIIIERITDLDIQPMERHISGLGGVDKKTTIKKWYKEAMPHVTLKRGVVKKKQAE